MVKLTSLTRRLVEAGHQVTVLTAIPNHPHGVYYPGYRATFYQRDRHMTVPLIRTYVWPYHGNVTWKRLVNYGSFALSALYGAPTLGDFDLLYVYHPPLTIGLPAWIISQLRHKPFLYDVQDIWPDAGVAAGAISAGVLYRAMRYLAMLVYQRAAAITVISPEFQDILVAQGVPRKKTHVVPNWADDTVYYPRSADGVRERYGLPSGVFLAMYAGNMGSTHGVEYLLHAAKLLGYKRDIHFVLVGTGPEYERMRRLQDELALTNVTFLGHKPHTEMPELLAAADLLVVHMRRSPLGAVSLPSRMLAYMACGRPMLVASEGAPRALVERHACGFGCEPDSPHLLAQAIASLATQPELLARLGTNGRNAYLQEYTEEIVTDRLISLMESIAGT
jgi:glycosyltransferase involved in cell wall biosynthesis